MAFANHSPLTQHQIFQAHPALGRAVRLCLLVFALLVSCHAAANAQATTVTNISPTSGPAGTTVTITGTAFTGAFEVDFGSVLQASASYTIVSDTEITATVPSNAITGPIYVFGQNNLATSNTFTVSGSSPPVISSFSPGNGVIGASVVVTGTGFTGATGVTIGSASDVTYTVDSDTQITATVPADASTGPISVTTANGTGTSNSSFTFIPVPTINDVEPDAGQPGDEILIVGTGFTNATSVAFNGTNAPDFLVISDEYISVYVPAGATTGAIAVVTPGGTATSSTFTVTAPLPTISGIAPSSGADGTSVVITGSGFTYVTAVAFNGVSANFTINSDGQITATVPVGATTGPITVTSPGGTATSGTFTVILPPTITAIAPSHGGVGVTVTITGTHLDGATSVSFHGTTASIATDTATQITTTVPAGATTGPISVTTPGGTATSASFTVIPPTSITSISPTSGLPGSSVAVHGAGFTDTSAVAFNGLATTFHVFSDIYLTTTVPVGATTGPISVTAPGGTAASATFTVIAPLPTISGFSPTSGPEGTSVVITGTGFTYVTSVAFNGLAAASFTINSDSQITAVVPTGATNGHITVTSPGGTATSAGIFTIPAPTVFVAASASPNPVAATTTALSVLGAYAGGESALTYTWSVSPNTGVSFSANGTNGAKNTTATFTQAGSYTFTVTITNPSGYSVTSTAMVVVNQTPTVTVTPATQTLNVADTQAFSAAVLDQFGNAVAGAVTWSSTGVGSIDSASGLYSAGNTPGSATVTASAAGTSGFASVTVK